MARAFELEGDSFALITAQPDADHDWLSELSAADIAALDTHEQTKVRSTR